MILADELREVGELEALEGEARRWPGAWHSRRRWSQIDDVARALALEHQTALCAAHIIAQNDFSRPFAGELSTVSDSERSTLRLKRVMKIRKSFVNFKFKETHSIV